MVDAYNWLKPYQAAVCETDRSKIAEKIKAAEDALRERAALDGQVSPEERNRLEEARNALLILRREWS
jgi:hypothetical protein